MKSCKLLSVFIAVVMLLSSMSVGAFAAQPKSKVMYRADNNVAVNLIEKQLNENAVQVQKKLVNASSYKFYDQLNATEKIIYNSIVNQEAGMNTSNGDFAVEVTNGDMFNDDFYEAYGSTIKAIAAVIDDVPELYWLLSVPYDIEYILLNNGNILISFTFLPEYSHLNSFAELKQEYKNTLNAAKDFTVTGSTRYEKVKSIAYGICDLAEYAVYATEYDLEVFYPSNCLLDPHEVVCDGYAKAFKMICDANNIPSIIVVGMGYGYDYWGDWTGEGHAWNYVQMEDGKWYAVDTTWMDDDPYPEEYFLVGSNSLDIFSDPFSATHVVDGNRFSVVDENGGWTPIVMTYPTLSTTAYDPNNVQVVPDPTPGSNTMLYGDVNFDGKISVVDAKLVLKAVSGSKILNEKQKAVADVNKDGKLTVVDAKWILQNIAGSRTLGEFTDNKNVWVYPYFVAVPDLGSLLDINPIKVVFYDEDENVVSSFNENGGVEYIYSVSDINKNSSIEVYTNFLLSNGYIYDQTVQVDETTRYAYYGNPSTLDAITICYYGSQTIGIYAYHVK